MYYVAYIVCFFLVKLPRRVRVEGRENIPKGQNFIIVANHIGLMDPWVIASFIPITTPVRWFTIEMLYDLVKVRQYLPKRFNNGWIGFILARIVIFTMKHTHTIKVAVQSYEEMSKEKEKEKKTINFTALRKANKVLKQPGGVIGIFAQRSRHGHVDDTSSSCLLLARKNKVPILPVHLSKGVMIIMEPEYVGKTINLLSDQKEERGIIAKELMAKILNQVT